MQKTCMCVLLAGMLLAGCAGGYKGAESSLQETSAEVSEEQTQDSTGKCDDEADTEAGAGTGTQTEVETYTENAEAILTLQTGRTLSDAIQEINLKTINNQESGVVDLFLEEYDASLVRQMIESYTFPDYQYISGRLITEEDRKEIKANRNLDSLSDETFQVSYGILIKNASVRSFPTAESITASNEESAENFDYFQESVLLIGEPVAVLHYSLDGLYAFVQGTNYFGWILKDSIQICDKELLMAVGDCADFVVITESFCDANEKTKDQLLRMGTLLPLLNLGENSYTAALFCEEQGADGYLVLYDGELCYFSLGDAPEGISGLWIREIEISTDAANAGFLELCEDNIIKLAKNMLGSTYSWGDGDVGYDCSSMIGSIYRCFGIALPRNTKNLEYAGANVMDLSEMTAQEKREFITSLSVGSILVLPGHVVMYMGEMSVLIGDTSYEAPAILHCVTGYVDVDGTKVEPYSCVLTSIDIYSRGDESYLDLINVCISF